VEPKLLTVDRCALNLHFVPVRPAMISADHAVNRADPGYDRRPWVRTPTLEGL